MYKHDTLFTSVVYVCIIAIGIYNLPTAVPSLVYTSTITELLIVSDSTNSNVIEQSSSLLITTWLAKETVTGAKEGNK